MANLPETSSWDAGVYEIQVTDAVVGGVSGIANEPGQNLVNRSLWLRNRIGAAITQAGLAEGSTDNQQLVEAVVLQCASAVILRSVPVPVVPNSQTVLMVTRGQLTDGDGLGALYKWAFSSTAADDGVTVIEPSSNPTAGRWLLRGINATALNGQIASSYLTTTAAAALYETISDAAAKLTTAEAFATAAATTAQNNAETFATGAAATAQSNAETFASGVAATAQSNAETFASGVAATAQSTAEAFATAAVAAQITSGSFTATAIGLTTSPGVTATYVKIGNMVILAIPAGLIGTSNSTTFGISGLPGAITPVSIWTGAFGSSGWEDNGAAFSGFISAIVGNTGQINLEKGGININWTPTGTKGMNSDGFVFTYSMN